MAFADHATEGLAGGIAVLLAAWGTAWMESLVPHLEDFLEAPHGVHLLCGGLKGCSIPSL
jgi:hypothetical protein